MAVWEYLEYCLVICLVSNVCCSELLFYQFSSLIWQKQTYGLLSRQESKPRIEIRSKIGERQTFLNKAHKTVRQTLSSPKVGWTWVKGQRHREEHRFKYKRREDEQVKPITGSSTLKLRYMTNVTGSGGRANAQLLNIQHVSSGKVWAAFVSYS